MVFESEREKFEGFNTASGKYCCNVNNTVTLVVRDVTCFNTASGKYCCNDASDKQTLLVVARFNTASGKYCCNL